MSCMHLLHIACCLCLSGLLGVLSPPAHAAYSCTVTATSTGLIYIPNQQDAKGSATLTCTRSLGDANSLSYRLKASDGLNAAGTAPIRRVRLNATSNYLFYSLRQGDNCGANTNWRAPATGNVDVMTGSLPFVGSALTASTTLNYCIRVRVGQNGNPTAPAAGIYSDTFNVFAQYPRSDTGALSPSAAVAMTVGVSNQCVFYTYPGNLVFSYTAFSASPQTASTSFMLRCSSGLPWSVSVIPNPAVLQGLMYTITPSPASGTGTGNTGQAVTLNGHMPAGQAGTCSGSTCAATQPHTVFITY